MISHVSQWEIFFSGLRMLNEIILFAEDVSRIHSSEPHPRNHQRWSFVVKIATCCRTRRILQDFTIALVKYNGI